MIPRLQLRCMMTFPNPTLSIMIKIRRTVQMKMMITVLISLTTKAMNLLKPIKTTLIMRMTIMMIQPKQQTMLILPTMLIIPTLFRLIQNVMLMKRSNPTRRLILSALVWDAQVNHTITCQIFLRYIRQRISRQATINAAYTSIIPTKTIFLLNFPRALLTPTAIS